ncbi:MULTISPECIES: zinc-binding dehydrogenase [unclassified Rathayibacter]|uniref:zinc-binding dehydrogenase n=1 Tax=unclassified Rathayibacter TaxID=2609250 RepID=UPI0006F4B47F|nr:MULTISPECIES: zinc-binding dehydrogenase [unclassified Rathayibacter]KQQ03389.1 NADPH:quinone reductase [Rathayibacter sp. Leaf294]KQS11844.1 NADPH:quinone reductase [Rathayibacter sp. Leaf185]
MTTTMRAIVLEQFGGPEVLQVRDVSIPVPVIGQVLVRVEAFGLNRSELYFRRGMGSFGSLPRIPGIEATGTVVQAPGGEFEPGQQVAALMGGMGRTIDGGYAQYTLVPATSVVPFTSTLDWATLGAIPEMLQTAHGSLTTGIDARPGDTILIRGGTSSVGLALAVLAKQRGMTVFSTTRSAAKAAALEQVGVDRVFLDAGAVADDVRAAAPGGVDGAVELVGTDTLRDTLRATRVHGTVCFTGMLSDVWTVPDFYPIDFLLNGVRLTAYSGEASDLPAAVLQEFIDAVQAGTATVPIGAIYALEDIADAHRAMETGTVTGKLVVTTR